MEHTQAVNIGATERYVLGELADDECEVFEAHYFSCAECAADVRAAAALAEGAATLLRDEARPLSPPAARARHVFGAPGRRSALGLFWPMPLGAAAAFVLAFAGLAWQTVTTSGLRRELAAATAPQAAQWAFLSVSRSEPQVVSVERDQRWLGLTLSRGSGDVFPRYRCRLARANGTSALEWTQPGPPAGGEMQLALPLRGLEPGRYTLTVEGLPPVAGAPVATPGARYDFSLSFRGK